MNVHNVVEHNVLLKYFRNFWLFLKYSHPTFFSYEIAFHWRKSFENVTTPLAKSDSIRANYTSILTINYKLLLFIYFKPNSNSACVYERYFSKFIKLVDDGLKLLIQAWFQISKKAWHKFAIWFIIPVVVAFFYLEFSLLFCTINNPEIALELL